MISPKQENNPLKIFVDSDAFVAFLKADDNNHFKAEKYFNELKAKNALFMTSNYVFAEVVTVLSQRIAHSVAVDFIQNIRSFENAMTIRWITEEIEGAAINIFIGQKSKNVSFVDCTNMALMEHFHMDAIFSFDEIYKKNGFKMISE